MPADEFDVDRLRGRRSVARWNRVSIGDIFERVRWSRPDAEALVAAPGAHEGETTRLTYAQADDLANQVANAMLERLQPGDIAVLVCENSLEAMLTKVGMAKAGVVAAPLNPNLADDVIGEILHRIAPKLAIVDAPFWPKIRPLLEQAGVCVGIVIAVGAERAPGIATFAEFVAGQSSGEPDVEIHGDDIAELLFTSGTSANPKAAMLSHINITMSALSFAGVVGRGTRFESDAVIGSFLPIIYHVADVVMYSAALMGGRAVVGRGPDFPLIVRTIAAEGITGLWAGMPRMIAAVAEAARADPSSSLETLNTIVYGWAPLPPPVFDAIAELCGHEVLMAAIIGMTEVVVAHRFWANQHEELYRRTSPAINFIGHPHPLLAARVVGDDDTDVDPASDALGEARYRSPALMSGYYGDRVATEEAFTGGWFHTGDMFQYGEGRNRAMVDRRKDVVKSGGENVSSIRVESAIEMHPGVVRAAVVGIPHEKWGEAVTAAVIPADPANPPSEADIVALCKQRLAPYEVPKRVVVVPELPQAVGGKLQKHLIRDSLKDTYEDERHS